MLSCFVHNSLHLLRQELWPFLILQTSERRCGNKRCWHTKKMCVEKQVVYMYTLSECNVVWHAFYSCSNNDFLQASLPVNPVICLCNVVDNPTARLYIYIFYEPKIPPLFLNFGEQFISPAGVLVASQQETKIKLTLTWGLFIVLSWSHEWKTWMQGDRRTYISLIDMYNASKWPRGQQRVSVVWGLMWKNNIYTPWKQTVTGFKQMRKLTKAWPEREDWMQPKHGL